MGEKIDKLMEELNETHELINSVTNKENEAIIRGIKLFGYQPLKMMTKTETTEDNTTKTTKTTMYFQVVPFIMNNPDGWEFMYEFSIPSNISLEDLIAINNGDKVIIKEDEE